MKYLALAFLSSIALVACSKPAPQSPEAQPMPVGDQSPSTDTPAPQRGMIMTTTIVVTNSGSTNTIGYRILIGANGEASYVSGDGAGTATLPHALFDKLKTDLDAAKPLSGPPQQGSCMKSASFGASTVIAVGGETSPDLECPGNEAQAALKTDVSALVAFLKLRNVPKSEGKELPPQNF